MESILIVSNYYPPEKGAAANRIEQLALKLSQHNFEVTVVCPLGNYPEGKLFPQYRNKFFVREKRGTISVKRLWIYPSNSHNILKRILSIQSFSTMLFFFLLFGKLPKKVVVQSPPLLLSFISVLALSIRRRKIILNVSDLWPLAGFELGVIKKDSVSYSFALFLEKFIYRKAAVIIGQSEEILAHIQTIVPDKKGYLYRNFPDHTQPFQFATAAGEPIKMFYAGLLGVAQGVLNVCENIVLPDNMEFHIFGDGAEKIQIESYLKTHPEKNIFFHGMLDRNELIHKLTRFDIAFVPLKARIYGSVPSKIFEYGALGMPILYFGGGEGEDIVSQNKLGWIAEVGNVGALNIVLREIYNKGSLPLQAMKSEIATTARMAFNLNVQIEALISKGVF
jgi:glycosyltransferase involved in cell wall biosynthesis